MSDLRSVVDQMGREVTYAFPPKRIVSLVPSQTEFLLELGAPVAGRTKFCVHPSSSIKDIPIIGGTKKFRLDAVDDLQPDLIIGNREENYKEGIEELSSAFPVWMSDIKTLDDAFQMMGALGAMCDLSATANSIVAACKAAIQTVENSRSGRVLYLIWQKPWMGAGRNTFIDHMLTTLGYENVLVEDRYPELTHEQIATLSPDKILLSSEPFPFNMKHLQQISALYPNTSVELVDGELYSWYGSRLKKWKTAN